MANNYKQHAEILIDKGLSIVPVHNKAPKFNEWQNIREEEILSTRYDKLWDKANGLGVLCGKISGVVCLDIDIYEDDKDRAELRKQVLSMLPPVYCGMIGNPKKPPSRLFRYNGEENKRFSTLGIDIISDGGQKVLPPSFNHDSKTYYQWVGNELYDIDVDDLPVMPKELLDFIYHKADQSNFSGDPKEIKMYLESGRCKHGSHDYISKKAVKKFYEGLGFEEIQKYVVELDKDINSDADYNYFTCPSRKWKSNDPNVNAMVFTSELIKRNAPLKANAQSVAIGNAPVADITSLDLNLNAKGNPINNIANIEKIFAADENLKSSVWFDSFHNKYMTNSNPDGSNRIREWDDSDDLRVTAYLQNVLGLHGVTDEKVLKGRILFCQHKVRHEPRDWISTISWDGVRRIDHFFSFYMGANDNEYVRAVSKNFWLSIIARIYKPGCKVDNMVILEGEQGTGKSTALSVIGGKWYVDSNINMDSNDFYLTLQGNVIVEMGELDAFNRTKEITTIKKVVSTATDRFRAPYAKTAKDHPRQCIFVGTTNEETYLRDATGNRRFWPIKTGAIDLTTIKKDRSQLFAESYSRFTNGERWHEVPSSAIDEQKSRREVDPWEDLISAYLMDASRQRKYTYVSEILTDALDIPKGSTSVYHSRKVGQVLRSLGYSTVKEVKILGKTTKCFAKKFDDLPNS